MAASGLGYLELCVIAEELGRALAPVPFSSSVYLATEALKSWGSEAQKQHYLPKLAAGELIGTLAMHEGLGRAVCESAGARRQAHRDETTRTRWRLRRFRRADRPR